MEYPPFLSSLKNKVPPEHLKRQNALFEPHGGSDKLPDCVHKAAKGSLLPLLLSLLKSSSISKWILQTASKSAKGPKSSKQQTFASN